MRGKATPTEKRDKYIAQDVIAIVKLAKIKYDHGFVAIDNV